MIKKITLCLMAMVLLASCSSKFGVQKRKYNKGFYVASAGGKHQTKNAAVVKNTKPIHLKTVEVSIPVQETKPVLAEAKVNHAITTPLKINSVVKPLKKHADVPVLAAAGKKPVALEPRLEKTQTYAADSKNTSSAARMDSGGKLIVEIILCFFWFFNLISVYMHDNKIGWNFWITLILDFTFILGVVFSLLVVVDVLDFN